jgi:hypothetical protein
MGEAGGQNPRLAGASASQHQDRTLQRLDSHALLGVQPREMLGHHRAFLWARRGGGRVAEWVTKEGIERMMTASNPPAAPAARLA